MTYSPETGFKPVYFDVVGAKKLVKANIACCRAQKTSHVKDQKDRIRKLRSKI